MNIRISAKKQIMRGLLAVFVLGTAACSNSASHIPAAVTPTRPSEINSYRFQLEKSLGPGIVEAADWAPDGSSFALVTSLGVDVYDAGTLQLTKTLATEQWSKSIAYSPDSKFLAAAAEDGTVQVWDNTSQSLIYKLTPSGIHPAYGNPPVLAFSRDSQTLISSLYQTLYVWDLATGSLHDSFPGYVDGIYTVALSPDGNFLVAAGRSQIYVRDVSTRELLYSPVKLPDVIVGLFFEQDSTRFSTVSSRFLFGAPSTGAKYGSSVRSWDLLTGEILDEHLATSSDIRITDINSTQDQIVLGEEAGISVWDTSANTVVFFMQGPTLGLNSVALSPQGGKLLLVGRAFANEYVQLWDLSSRQKVKSFDQYNLTPAEVAFSPDEELVAIASFNGAIQVRQVQDGKLLYSLSGGAPLAFSPDGQTIAFTTLGENNRVLLASTETGKLLLTPTFPCSGVKALAFHPDGDILALGGNQCDLELYDIQTGTLASNLSQVEGNESLYFEQLFFSPDGKKLFLGGYEPKILDVQSGKIIKSIGNNYMGSALLSPDGRYLALGGLGDYNGPKKVEIWDTAADRLAFTIDTLQTELYHMAFSPDGRLLVTSGEGLELWDLWEGNPLAKLETAGETPVKIAFSADGRTLITFGKDGSLRHWRIEPDPQMTLRSHPTPTAMPTLAVTPTVPPLELASIAELGRGYSSTVYHSADGRLAGFIEEDRFKWFDAASHRQLGAVKADNLYGAVVFSPNDRFAIVSDYGGAHIVDLEKQSIVGYVSGGTGNAFGFTFTRDSHFMAYTIGSSTTGGPYFSIGLWNLEKQTPAFEGYDYFRTLLEDRYHTMSAPAISPDGKLVAAGHSDKSIYVWDLQTGKSRLRLEGHAESVATVDFSADGKILASGSRDGTIRLWEPLTGRLIKVLTGFRDDIDEIHFTPDGHSLRVSVTDQPEQQVSLDMGKIQPVPTPAAAIDPLEMQQLQQGFSKDTGNAYSQVLFSPDGSRLALVNQSVLLWDVATKKLLALLDNSAGGGIRGAAFNSAGTLLAAATDDDRVLVWEVNTGKRIFERKSAFLSGITVAAAFGDPEPGLARGSDVLAEQGLAFSPDGDRLAFGSGTAIEVWDVRRSEKVAGFTNPEGSYPTQFSFSEDGQRLYVVLNRNRSAQVWDLASGKSIRQIKLTEVDPNAYTAVALRAPLFARNNSDDQGKNWIELWDLDKKEFIKIDVPSAQNEPLRFSPDGSLLAARLPGDGGPSVYFWKTGTGELLYRAGFEAKGLAISSDNRRLAAGLDGRAKIYDLQPVTALSLQAHRQVPVAPSTPTPVSFAWPTTTPAPLPSPSAEESTANVIDTQNASHVEEKASFGSGTIGQLIWSPGGDALVTSGSLGVSEYFFDRETKTLSERLQTETEGWTYQTVFLPDGRILAASVDSGRVRVRDLSSGDILAEVEGGEPALSPDGRVLAYLDPQDSLQTWDLIKRQPALQLKSSYTYSHRPVFSPDGKSIAAIQSAWRYGDSVRVWNTRTGEIINALAGPDNDITDLSFSPDGKFLVGAAGGSAWVWDIRPGPAPEKIQLYEVEINGNLNLYTHTVTAAALSPDNQVVAIGTSEGDLRLYDRRTQQLRFRLKEYASPIRHLRFSADGKMLASVDEDGEISLWDMTSQQRIASAQDHKGPIAGLVYRTDGDLAAWGAGVAWQIDPQKGTLQQDLHVASGRILAISPAGDLLAAYDPLQVSLWDAQSGKFLQRLEGEAQEPVLHYRFEGMAFRQFYSAVFSQDGRYLATAGAGGVWYYETGSRKLLQQLPGSNAQKIAMSPDGTLLLTSLSEQDEPVALYDVHTGSQVFALDEYGWGSSYLQSAFSPDGRWVGTVKRGWDDPLALVIYEAASHQVYRSMPLEQDIVLTSLAFHPLEQIVAVGTADGKILLIDFSTLKILTTLAGHHAEVGHLVFSPDGKYLISAGADGTIRTWGLP